MARLVIIPLVIVRILVWNYLPEVHKPTTPAFSSPGFRGGAIGSSSTFLIDFFHPGNRPRNYALFYPFVDLPVGRPGSHTICSGIRAGDQAPVVDDGHHSQSHGSLWRERIKADPFAFLTTLPRRPLYRLASHPPEVAERPLRELCRDAL